MITRISAFFRSLTDLYLKSYSGLPRRVWLLALVLLINRSGAMVVAFLSVYLINEQGLPPSRAGFVMAAFGAGGIMGNYVGGLLNDRFGSWHIMFISLIGAGVMHILLGEVQSYGLLCLMAFLVSLWADAFRPANRAAIAVYAPPDKFTRAFGLMRMAVNLGYSVGPAVGGYLIYHYGFRLVFWGDGLSFLAAAVAFYLLLPPDETARPLVSAEERRQADAVGGSAAATPAHRQAWLLLFVLANACLMICFFQLFSVFSVYLKTEGFDERGIGWIYTLSSFLIVAVEMPLLYLIGKRRYGSLPVMVVGGALLFISFAILPLVAPLGFLPVLAMAFLMTFGEMLYMPFTNTFVSHYAPPSRRGEYLGVLSASYSAAFVVTPVLGFAVAETYGSPASILTCCTVAFLGWLVLGRVGGVLKQALLRRRAGRRVLGPV